MNDDPMNDPSDQPTINEPFGQLPPPLPPPPPRPSWWHVPISRDPDDHKVGGVASGIARAYGFDVRTTRIATLVGAIAVPGLFALYIAAWIMLPAHPAEARPLSAIITERRRRPLLIAVGIVALSTGFGSWSFFGGVGWGFALVALGVVLWLAPNFGSPTAVATHGTYSPAAPDAATPEGATSVRPRRRRRRPVQAVALLGATAAALVMGIGNSANWWHATIYSIVVTVLAVLVAGTVIGAIVNRSWLGLPMLPVLLATSVGVLITHPNLDGGFGDRKITPATVQDAQRSIRLGAGRLTIDLTALPAGEQPVTVDAEVGFGQIRIIVPAADELHLVSYTGAGHTVIDGTEISDGVRHDEERTIPPSGPPSASEGHGRTITLHLEVGGGEIDIRRAG